MRVTNFVKDTLTTPTVNRPIDEYAELMADLPSILSTAEHSYEMVVPEVCGFRVHVQCMYVFI